MGKDKKILILTSDAGFGHRSAANAIAAALAEKHPDGCRVEIVNPLEEPGSSLLLRHGESDYDKIVREVPELYRLGYEMSDTSVPSTVVESALMLMMLDVMRNLVRRCQPDAIVTTYPLYQAALKAVYVLQRQQVPLLTVVTDLAAVHRLWFHNIASLTLVPTEPARNLALSYGLEAQRVLVTGIPVHPAFAQKQEAGDIRTALGWQEDRVTILVVGSKRVGHLEPALNLLNHSGLPIQLALVAGGDDALYQRLQEFAWHVPAYSYNFVTDMPAMMHAADGIICKAGGLIVTEALACGLPLLLIDVLPGQESGNADYVIEQAAGERAQSPAEVLEILYHWLDHNGELLAQRARNAQRLGHPRAAYQVAELAWQAALRGPAATTSRQARARAKILELLNRYGILWQED
ncbi:MAG: hypothetical protein JW900_07090 [Anaerolineae bacterium]|nr:hypothetical protein [Anaerolineae bacterium]